MESDLLKIKYPNVKNTLMQSRLNKNRLKNFKQILHEFRLFSVFLSLNLLLLEIE
jgi:hypothetical protein